MKKILLFSFLFCAMSLNLFSQYSIVGNWKADDETEDGYMLFDASGNLKMTAGDESFDMTYSIDFSTTPASIDLIVDESLTFPGIIQFLSADAYKIRLAGEDGLRPKDFLPEGNDETETFYRVD